MGPLRRQPCVLSGHCKADTVHPESLALCSGGFAIFYQSCPGSILKDGIAKVIIFGKLACELHPHCLQGLVGVCGPGLSKVLLPVHPAGAA